MNSVRTNANLQGFSLGRKWSISFFTVFILTVFSIAIIVIRGTWADVVPYIPSSSKDGITSQLYLNSNGDKQVRCTAILNYSQEEVWSVITDYEHYYEIFNTKLWRIKLVSITQLQDGRVHLLGEIISKFGTWPIDTYLIHSVSADRYILSWDQPSGNIKINKGSWTITPIGLDKTLVVYSLESTIDCIPNFITNNILLSQLKPVVIAVENRLKEKHIK